MKFFNKIVLVSGISAVLLSCTSELDVQPEGTPTEASFWKTENDLVTGQMRCTSLCMTVNFMAEVFLVYQCQ